MATAIIKRPLQVTDEQITVNLSYGQMQEIGDAYYLPLTIDNVNIPDITVEGVSGTDGTAVLTTVTPGGFDNVRVGDVIKSFSGSGDAGTSSNALVGCYVANGLNTVVYTEVYEPALPVKVGDDVSGTNVAAGAKVDKIDYASRTIYLDLPNTGNGEEDLTFNAPARVIEVTPSTDADNPNQITIDRALVAGPSSEILTIVSGVTEGVFAILRLNPLDNTEGSKLSYTLGVHYPDSRNITASDSGLGNEAFVTLGYTRLEGMGIDIDTYLTNLRVPRGDN